MDELPQAIQKEIWDYVRGDRRYWKQQHQQLVTDNINMAIDRTEWDLFQLGRRWTTKPKLLKYYCRIQDAVVWSYNLPQFMKHQHQCHGQLFSDSKEEHVQKQQEWDEWRQNSPARTTWEIC